MLLRVTDVLTATSSSSHVAARGGAHGESAHREDVQITNVIPMERMVLTLPLLRLQSNPVVCLYRCQRSILFAAIRLNLLYIENWIVQKRILFVCSKVYFFGSCRTCFYMSMIRLENPNKILSCYNRNYV